jgi:hypothetical protein
MELRLFLAERKSKERERERERCFSRILEAAGGEARELGLNIPQA